MGWGKDANVSDSQKNLVIRAHDCNTAACGRLLRSFGNAYGECPESHQPAGRSGEPAAAAGELRCRSASLGTVGPPTATLSVSIIEPKGGVPPRGTILVLHGIYARSITMLPQARALAYAGYRVALVDLRGHGRSTGDYLTYGVREARDVSQVIDAIEGQQLIAGRIGVLGISYWNSVVLQQAAPDHSARIPIPHGGHTSLWFDLDGSVSTHAIEWFDRWLGQRLT